MQAKTKEMQESMKLLDVEMKRSDELLSQMIPKSVSDKIKAGANAVDTCEVFDMVTMVFNDIPAFLDICAKCDGLKVILFASPKRVPVNMTKYVIIFQIVGMLNMMFGLFDVMTEKNGIYKVTLVLSMSLPLPREFMK